MPRSITLSYLFFSFLFIGLISFSKLNVFWVLKIIPITLLAIVVFRDVTFTQRWLLFGALVASALGDILLHQDLFIAGLSAFLIAQVQYAIIFFKHHHSIKHRKMVSALLLVFFILMLIVLLPNLGKMLIPVSGYLIVISLMGFLAVQSKLPFKWAILGALIFILSDTFIAIHKFIVPLPFDRILVMSTYYAAQWMLVQGFLNSRMNSSE